MPIPPFDSNDVLPPHGGDPRDLDQLSPYPCTTLELCQRFATSVERRAILNGFLRFRDRLQQLSLSDAFQWLDGSFLEAVEVTESRPPNDLDVVTFYVPPSATFNTTIVTSFPEFWDNSLSKANFQVDHFPADIGYMPYVTVEITRYWTALFSHRRDSVWKGMLRIELNTPSDDSDARTYLQGLP